MSSKTEIYPKGIYMESNEVYGWGVIMRGHGLSDEQIVEQLQIHDPAVTEDVEISGKLEEYMGHMNRVKWCERHTDPCAMNGEYHEHWYSLNKNDDSSTHFTIVTYK